jgi:hypothetical protein
LAFPFGISKIHSYCWVGHTTTANAPTTTTTPLVVLSRRTVPTADHPHAGGYDHYHHNSSNNNNNQTMVVSSNPFHGVGPRRWIQTNVNKMNRPQAKRNRTILGYGKKKDGVKLLQLFHREQTDYG